MHGAAAAAEILKMSAVSKCNVCGEPSRHKCGNCHGTPYCSKDHQKLDWKNHKANCTSYKVVTDEKMGRHLVATRSISEGETIIKEAPIIAGPSQVTPPVCLGCYNLLSQFNARDCSLCGWPVCSEACERSPAHRPECEITSRHKNGKVKIQTFDRNLPHPSYQCLTVLRCLYLKKAQPSLWAKLMNLESHCEERKSTLKYSADQMFIAKFIPTFFNFLDFSDEEILKVAGIIQVNAHEVPLREPEFVAIYEKASFLEHDCRANCMKSFTNSGEVVIRAAEKISPGDHLSICYTDPLWGREMRGSHLMETKFFRCRCKRCLDPTEFGTHFNSLKCPERECNGYSIPASEFDPKSVNARTWKCQRCGRITSEEQISNLFSDFSRVDKKTVKSCTDFIQKYEKILHPNQHLLVSVKLDLLDLFGWPNALISLKERDLEWTTKTCKEIYDLTTRVVPAENRLRGVLLYHLHFALNECGRRQAAKMEVDPLQVKENLLECRNILLKAYKLLSYEPDELPEGKMAIEAKRSLENMEQCLKDSK